MSARDPGDDNNYTDLMTRFRATDDFEGGEGVGPAGMSMDRYWCFGIPLNIRTFGKVSTKESLC